MIHDAPPSRLPLPESDSDYAKVSAFNLRRATYERTANPEDREVSLDRQAGHNLIEKLTQDADIGGIAARVNEQTAVKLRNAIKGSGVPAAIQCLGEMLQQLKQSLASELPLAQQTAEKGGERKKLRQQFETHTTILLAMAEQLCRKGDVINGVQAFLNAKLDLHDDDQEPAWALEPMLEALKNVEITNPQIRDAIAKLDDSYTLHITAPRKNELISKSGQQALRLKEQLFLRGYEASQLKKKEEAARAESTIAESLTEKEKSTILRILQAAIQDGLKACNEYGNDSRKNPRFSDRGEGSFALNKMQRENFELMQQVNENESCKGADGYLKMLSNVLKDEVLEKFVAFVDEQNYFRADDTRKRKAEYEAEGNLKGWRTFIKGKISTEVLGNMLGWFIALAENASITEAQKQDSMTKGFTICEQTRFIGNNLEKLSKKSLHDLAAEEAHKPHKEKLDKLKATATAHESELAMVIRDGLSKA